MGAVGVKNEARERERRKKNYRWGNIRQMIGYIEQKGKKYKQKEIIESLNFVCV